MSNPWTLARTLLGQCRKIPLPWTLPLSNFLSVDPFPVLFAYKSPAVFVVLRVEPYLSPLLQTPITMVLNRLPCQFNKFQIDFSLTLDKGSRCTQT